jgi:hypothetical protein
MLPGRTVVAPAQHPDRTAFFLRSSASDVIRCISVLYQQCDYLIRGANDNSELIFSAIITLLPFINCSATDKPKCLV